MGPASRRMPRVFVYTERTVDGMGKYCTKKRDQLCHPERNAARRAVEGSRQGFTLMELMVYIAIVGIVVIVAGQAFSNSTKMRVRTQSMLKASEVAENVATLFKQDVAQTGAKSSMEERGSAGSDDVFSGVKKAVYMDPKVAGDPEDKVEDLSSFRFKPVQPTVDGNLDSLILRRVRYSESGKYEAVEEILWALDGKVLSRTCRIIEKADGAANGECAPSGTTYENLKNYAVEMATGVESFIVLPAVPGALVADGIQMFPPGNGTAFKLESRYGEARYLPATISAGGTNVTVSSFASNVTSTGAPITDDTQKNKNEVYVFANTAATGNWKSLCIDSDHDPSANHFSFKKGLEYEISFTINVTISDLNPDMAQTFVPGLDHMAVGIRNAKTEKIGEKIDGVKDFLFYPPTTAEANTVQRVIRFTVPDDIEKACLAFTFSMYSPSVASGSITIGNFRLNRVANSDYKFDKNTTYVAVADKKNVKAFQLKLKVTRNGESGEALLVVPIPSNGPTD